MYDPTQIKSHYLRKSTFLAIYFVFWKNQLLRGIHYFKYNHINEKLLTRAFIWCMIHMPEALSWVCLCRVVRRLWYVCLDMRLYTALRGRRAKSTQFRGNFQVLFCHNFWTRLLRPMYHTSNESPCQELFNDMIGFGIVYPPQKLVFWKNKINCQKCWFSQIVTPLINILVPRSQLIFRDDKSRDKCYPVDTLLLPKCSNNNNSVKTS